MRYSASQQASEKLPLLALDGGARSDLAGLLSEVESAASRVDLVERMAGAAVLLEGDVFVLRRGNVRAFVSFGQDATGEYALLLDVASMSSYRTIPRIPSARDPRHNIALNPQLNPAINPRFNSSLNPRFNSAINPRYNVALNPQLNPAINPRFNSSLNPWFNSTINPRYNSAVNPRFNSSINPRFNTAYTGPYIYDNDLTQLGFVVRANESVLLFFEDGGEFTGYGVLNAVDGYALFDINNEWIGQLIPNGQGGFLRFDVESELTGLVV